MERVPSLRAGPNTESQLWMVIHLSPRALGWSRTRRWEEIDPGKISEKGKSQIYDVSGQFTLKRKGRKHGPHVSILLFPNYKSN